MGVLVSFWQNKETKLSHFYLSIYIYKKSKPVPFHKRSSFSVHSCQRASGIGKFPRMHHSSSLRWRGTLAPLRTNQTYDTSCG